MKAISDYGLRSAEWKRRHTLLAFVLLVSFAATLPGCISVDVKKIISEGVTLASEQTYAHLSKPEVREEIIDNTVERAALKVKVEANTQYDAILLDLKTPGLTWKKLVAFILTIGGLLGGVTI